jgi:hypothetical protein
MTNEDLSKLSAPQLVEQFRSTAMLTPTIWTDKGVESLQRTPERAERVARMQALGAELRRRTPIADVRPLYQDMDADVRSWAASQLFTIDPEWARAALGSVSSGLSPHEVFDLARRARQTYPREPTIKDMSDEELVARFEDAATREYAMNFHDPIGEPRDLALLNRIFTEVWAAADELRARGKSARLTPYLSHRFLQVRRQAARACLDVEPERAQAVLTDMIANCPDISQRLHASDVLENWRKRQPTAAAKA